MRRLAAIALMTGSAATSQALLVAPIGTSAHWVSLDSATAPLPSMPRYIASSLRTASTATLDGARQGNVWTWIALGAPDARCACLFVRFARRLVEAVDTDRASSQGSNDWKAVSPDWC